MYWGLRGQDPAKCAAAHAVHLPQPILSMHESEREIGVVFGLGVNEGYAVAIADDLHGSVQALQRNGAVLLRQ